MIYSLKGNPRLCRGTHRVWRFREAWVVARGQGPGAQKASAGLAPFRGASLGFRRRRRARGRSTGSPLRGFNPRI